MKNTPIKRNPKDWDSFWQHSSVTSMMEAFKSNYDGEVLEFWRGQLDENISSIIDLACGNGALTWMANELLNKSKDTVRVTGIDFSDIHPFKILKRNPARYPMISFMGNTSIESLPLKTASVDMAISQWGIEYSNLEQTIPELSRVLKPSAKIAFICHYDASQVMKNSRVNIAKYEAILSCQVHDRFMALHDLFSLHANEAAVKSAPDYNRVMSELNRALSDLAHSVKNSVDPDIQLLKKFVDELTGLFGNFNYKNRAETIRQHQKGIESNVHRLEDLFSASLSEEREGQLVRLLEVEGFNIIQRVPIVHTGTKATIEQGDIGLAIVAGR